MLQADIFIDTRRKAKKGYPIKLQIYCSLTQQRKYIHTKRYQQSKSRRTAEAQQELSKLLNRLEPLRDLELQEALPLLQKEGDLEIWAMEQKLNRLQKFVDFYAFTESLIREKESVGLSIQAYKDAIREVRNYMLNEPFGLNDITYNWVKGFELYKRRNGTKDGGISYYLRTLRTIHNESKKRIEGVKDTKPFHGLIKNVPSPEHESKYWYLDDLKRLRQFSHSNATEAAKTSMQRVIDLFFFQIFIGGHDLVDVANLKWADIVKREPNKFNEGTEGYRLEFKRFKNRNKPNGGREISNALIPEAINIICKYGDRSSNQIFSFLGSPASGTYTHRNFGASLKRISIEMGIIPHLTTKTPRYVFRSTAGDLLIHDLVLESILGHKSTSISRKYQKRISFEIQDELHFKVVDSIYTTHEERFYKTMKEFDELRFSMKEKQKSFGFVEMTNNLKKKIAKLKEEQD